MNIFKQIDRIIKKRNSPQALHDAQLNLQFRLKQLVDEHGIDVTAHAAGLTVASLSQYLRNKRPTSIGEKSVVQAEEIIKELL